MEVVLLVEDVSLFGESEREVQGGLVPPRETPLLALARDNNFFKIIFSRW